MLQFRDRFYAFRGYGVRYAIRTLVDIAPERLVAVAERTWDRVPAAEKEADSFPSTRAALNLLGMILDRVLDALADGRTLSALIGSKMPLLRALAAQHVLPTPSQANATLSFELLRGLKPDEQLEALAECVSELRVEANRNEYKEPETVHHQRIRVLEEIVRLWPTNMDDSTLRRLARRLGGPGEGGWAPSTTEELFSPLVKAGSLTWERVSDLWFTVLREKFGTMLSRGSGSSYSFYGPNDIPLTEAAVLALSRSRRDVRERWREELTTVQADALRVAGAPFARSRDYSRWADASECLRWLGAVVGCVLLKAADTLEPEERRAWAAHREQILEVLSRQTVRREPGVAAFEQEVQRLLLAAKS
jgi:hypothetical protein